MKNRAYKPVELYRSYNGEHHKDPRKATASTIDTACEMFDGFLKTVSKAENGADYLTPSERFAIVTKLFQTVDDVVAFSKAFAELYDFLDDCAVGEGQFP